MSENHCSTSALSAEAEQKRRRAIALDLIHAALAAVEPSAALKQHVRLVDNRLVVDGRSYDIDRYRRVFVVGGGKATAPMAQAIEDILGSRITAGVVNVKYGYSVETNIIEINQAGHPIPDQKGVAGTQRMAELVQEATEDDLVIALVSGGGSSLMVLPPPGISLADKRRLTDGLLRSGATINEMNVVRKHLSQIKGGGLARLAHPAEVITLMLSDVVGSPLDVIASGPTVPDTSTYADVWNVLDKHGLTDELPPSIAERLVAGREGAIPETPKAGDPSFARCHNAVIASNEIAARAAVERARNEGLKTLLLSTYVEGEAREIAQMMAAIAKEMVHSDNPVPRPACIVVGGETTVRVKGQGLGGRNQELALAAAIQLDGWEDVMLVTLATDGSDGPTDAAGAIIDGTTVDRALGLGLNPDAYLSDNDSYHFFHRLGDLVVTGPTNTNVNDLTFILAFQALA